MESPLSGVWAKIERANEHIKELDIDLSGRNKRTAYTVTLYREPNTNVIRLDQPLPDDMTRIPTIIGDVLYQLRSSLDHLVGRLEDVNGQGRTDGFEFPIFWEPDKYKTAAPRKIRGVSGTAAANIEKLQPYHRGNPAYRDHPLWILHDLNITDKHRVLISVAAGIVANNLNINIRPGIRHTTVLSVPAKDRAEPPMFCTEMDVKPEFTLSATFGQFGSVKGQPIIPGLQQLRDFVLGLVKDFESEFV